MTDLCNLIGPSYGQPCEGPTVRTLVGDQPRLSVAMRAEEKGLRRLRSKAVADEVKAGGCRRANLGERRRRPVFFNFIVGRPKGGRHEDGEVREAEAQKALS
jgi:hypothetical protein